MLSSPHNHRRRVSTPQSPQNGGRLRRRAFSQKFVARVEQPQKEIKMAEEANDNEENSDDGDDSSESDARPPKNSALPMKNCLPLRQESSRPVISSKSGDDGIADLEKSMSALKFVPTSVTLNRRGKK